MKNNNFLKNISYLFLFLFILSTIGIIIESFYFYFDNKIKTESLIIYNLVAFTILILIFWVYLFKTRAYKKIKLHFIKDPRYHQDMCKKTRNKNIVHVFYLILFILFLITIWLIFWWVDLYNENSYYFNISLVISNFSFWFYLFFWNWNFCNKI